MISYVFILCLALTASYCQNQHKYQDIKAVLVENEQPHEYNRYIIEQALKAYQEAASNEAHHQKAHEPTQPAISSQNFVMHQSHVDSHETNNDNAAPKYFLRAHPSAYVGHYSAPIQEHASEQENTQEIYSNHVSEHAPSYAHQPAQLHHVHHEEAKSHESHEEPIDYYAHPKYQYEYKVEDPNTGDHKYQKEYRDGDDVKGVYSLLEADGSIRTVEYTSDKHNGFVAVVKHSAPGQHVEIKTHHQN